MLPQKRKHSNIDDSKSMIKKTCNLHVLSSHKIQIDTLFLFLTGEFSLLHTLPALWKTLSLVNKKAFELIKKWVQMNCWFRTSEQEKYYRLITYDCMKRIMFNHNSFDITSLCKITERLTLTHLIIQDVKYSQKSCLPNTLTHLEIRLCKSQTIPTHLSGLRYLKLGEFFDHSLDNLPDNLQELIIHPDSEFDSPIEHLPKGLKILIMNNKFNQSVDNLPPGLLELRLGAHFNQPINMLPVTLTKLWVMGLSSSDAFIEDGKDNCGIFNQDVLNLPLQLKELRICSISFHKSLGGIPENVERLGIHLKTIYQLNSYSYETICFPKRLVCLLIDFVDDNIISKIPNTLYRLHTNTLSLSCTTHFPTSLSILHIGEGVQQLDTISCFVYELPDTITELYLNGVVHINSCSLPESILHLEFGDYYNQCLPNLPKNVRYLKLGRCFKKSIKNLPKSITELHTHSSYNHLSLCKYKWNTSEYYNSAV